MGFRFSGILDHKNLSLKYSLVIDTSVKKEHSAIFGKRLCCSFVFQIVSNFRQELWKGSKLHDKKYIEP